MIGSAIPDGDRTIHCWVRDTGKGIPEERLAKVFDKLETDPHKGGSGLGLAIVKQVIEAHGGHITVASKVGEGTTFKFILPLEDTAGLSPKMGNGTAA